MRVEQRPASCSGGAWRHWFEHFEPKAGLNSPPAGPDPTELVELGTDSKCTCTWMSKVAAVTVIIHDFGRLGMKTKIPGSFGQSFEVRAVRATNLLLSKKASSRQGQYILEDLKRLAS